MLCVETCISSFIEKTLAGGEGVCICDNKDSNRLLAIYGNSHMTTNK